jgi:predicted metal-binding protein
MNRTTIVQQVNPVIDYEVTKLCVRPYHGHKKGCPNFNKKKGCPPNSPKFDQIYDIDQPIFAIINRFDFSKHINRMKDLHPGWSQKQLECCLYWQPKARKSLNDAIWFFNANISNIHYSVERCPEAMGVNVTETLKQIGIELEWPPKTVTYQVALAGIRRQL